MPSKTVADKNGTPIVLEPQEYVAIKEPWVEVWVESLKARVSIKVVVLEVLGKAGAVNHQGMPLVEVNTTLIVKAERQDNAPAVLMQ